MSIRSASLAVLAASALLWPSLALAGKLPTYEVTLNGTWDCRDPAGTFMGTVVIADEAYAFMNTDETLGGYGKLRLLSFDTHLPNYALLSGPLKDEFGAAGGGIAGPRENYEEMGGELFLTVAVSTRRTNSWYCTGRRPPEGLM